jgi:hypothetical protein
MTDSLDFDVLGFDCLPFVVARQPNITMVESDERSSATVRPTNSLTTLAHKEEVI